MYVLFSKYKYDCIDSNLPLCNRCSIEDIEESTLDWLALKRVGHCLACVEHKKRLLETQASSSTSSTGKSKKMTVKTK